MTTVSVTERRTFRTCRQEWEWASLNHEGLEPVMPNRKLLLGSLIHYTLADWVEDWSLDPVARFVDHWRTAEIDIKGRYLTKFQDTMTDDELAVRYGIPVHDLGRAMISNYKDYYKTPLPKGWTILQAEQTVTIDVPGTEHWECRTPEAQCCTGGYGGCRGSGNVDCCDMVAHKLEGTFDAIARDPAGSIFIVDHKTFERKPSGFELAEDDQFLAYTWMVSQLGIGKVRGVMYNGLWKRAYPPKGKTIDDLFFRSLIPRDQELADFGRRLPVEVNEMCNNPTIYINPAWYSCPSCGFRDMCIAMRRGEDYQDLLEEYAPRTRTPAWRAA